MEPTATTPPRGGSLDAAYNAAVELLAALGEFVAGAPPDEFVVEGTGDEAAGGLIVADAVDGGAVDGVTVRDLGVDGLDAAGAVGLSGLREEGVADGLVVLHAPNGIAEDLECDVDEGHALVGFGVLGIDVGVESSSKLPISLPHLFGFSGRLHTKDIVMRRQTAWHST